MMVLRGRIQSLKDNPLLLKEWRSRAHRRLLSLFSCLYLLMWGCVTLTIFLPVGLLLFVEQSIEEIWWAMAGAAVFMVTALLEGMLLLFVTPALTVSAITGEKQRQTYDILRTTTLSAQHLVSGKLLAALRYPLLLIALSTALQLLTVFTGDIYLADVLVFQMMMVVTMIATATLGLLCSTFFRSTLGATILAYSLLGFMLVGIPVLVGTSRRILEEWNMYNAHTNVPLIATEYTSHLVGSMNLPYALVQTITIRAEADSYWGRTERPGWRVGTPLIWYPSPWYLYIFWQIALSWVAFRGAVWQVQRIPT